MLLTLAWFAGPCILFSGLACIWADYSYNLKTYVALATPIIVALFLAVPVSASWILAAGAAKSQRARPKFQFDGPENGTQDSKAEKNVDWKERYERTLDVFWNNFMV